MVKHKRINKWFWFQPNDKPVLISYVYNPYLKTAKECLESWNVINKTSYNLKDGKWWFES